MGILDIRKGVYFDGSNTTNRILDVLEEERPSLICLDELDKMPKQFQEKLLKFLGSGKIKVDQQRKQYDFKIEGIRSLPHVTKLTGYPNLCGLALDVCTFPNILESNSCRSRLRSAPSCRRRHSDNCRRDMGTAGRHQRCDKYVQVG